MRTYMTKPKKEYSWVKYIHHRIAQNKNFLALTTGSTGSGKSWSNLAIGELLDPEFNIDRVVFSGNELMQLINSGTLKKGSVIVFEEVGVNASSAQWQSTFNKMLNFLFQTFRAMNFILLMNAPYSLFADKRIRVLLHAKFKVVGINRQEQKTILKPLLCQYNDNIDKVYEKRLRLKLDSGKYYIVDKWGVPKASDKLIQDYEIKKAKFNRELNEEILKEFEGMTESKTKQLTGMQETVLQMLNNKKVVCDIADDLDISERAVSKHMEALRNKGYKIQAVKEQSKVLFYNVDRL